MNESHVGDQPEEEDRDVIGEFEGHVVCWRYYGDQSPNRGEVGLILKERGTWFCLGTWKRGPIDVASVKEVITGFYKRKSGE
jgi:hypothetical protein